MASASVFEINHYGLIEFLNSQQYKDLAPTSWFKESIPWHFRHSILLFLVNIFG